MCRRGGGHFVRPRSGPAAGLRGPGVGDTHTGHTPVTAVQAALSAGEAVPPCNARSPSAGGGAGEDGEAAGEGEAAP